jgi:hypothetical protein
MVAGEWVRGPAHRRPGQPHVHGLGGSGHGCRERHGWWRSLHGRRGPRARGMATVVGTAPAGPVPALSEGRAQRRSAARPGRRPPSWRVRGLGPCREPSYRRQRRSVAAPDQRASGPPCREALGGVVERCPGHGRVVAWSGWAPGRDRPKAACPARVPGPGGPPAPRSGAARERKVNFAPAVGRRGSAGGGPPALLDAPGIARDDL